jgi:hypothetical protein
MEERCALTELVKDQCAHCRSKGRKNTPDRRFRRVEAQRRGVCQCGTSIRVGDEIYNVEGDWVCDICAREAS